MRVTLDDETVGQGQIQSDPRVRTGPIIKLIIKTGLAKNTAQASIIMLLVSVLCIAITLLLIWPTDTEIPIPDEMIQQDSV